MMVHRQVRTKRIYTNIILLDSVSIQMHRTREYAEYTSKVVTILYTYKILRT